MSLLFEDIKATEKRYLGELKILTVVTKNVISSIIDNKELHKKMRDLRELLEEKKELKYSEEYLNLDNLHLNKEEMFKIGILKINSPKILFKNSNKETLNLLQWINIGLGELKVSPYPYFTNMIGKIKGELEKNGK